MKKELLDREIQRAHCHMNSELLGNKLIQNALNRCSNEEWQPVTGILTKLTYILADGVEYGEFIKQLNTLKVIKLTSLLSRKPLGKVLEKIIGKYKEIK